MKEKVGRDPAVAGSNPAGSVEILAHGQMEGSEMRETPGVYSRGEMQLMKPWIGKDCFHCKDNFISL